MPKNQSAALVELLRIFDVFCLKSDKKTQLVLEEIKRQIEQGQTVKINGFSKFSVRAKSARKGRNPQTNEAIEISARKVASFKPSKVLINALAPPSSDE